MTADERFTDQQRQGLGERQGDQDRALAAMHRLEAALESPTFGREDDWRADVLVALTVLHTVSAEAADEATRPDSLLSDVAWNQPRLRNRVRGIRARRLITCSGTSRFHERAGDRTPGGCMKSL